MTQEKVKARASYDLFGQSYVDSISLERERKLHTRATIFFTCIFYTIMVIACCVGIVSLVGADGFNQESYSLRNL